LIPFRRASPHIRSNSREKRESLANRERKREEGIVTFALGFSSNPADYSGGGERGIRLKKTRISRRFWFTSNTREKSGEREREGGGTSRGREAKKSFFRTLPLSSPIKVFSREEKAKRHFNFTFQSNHFRQPVESGGEGKKNRDGQGVLKKITWNSVLFLVTSLVAGRQGWRRKHINLQKHHPPIRTDGEGEGEKKKKVGE